MTKSRHLQLVSGLRLIGRGGGKNFHDQSQVPSLSRKSQALNSKIAMEYEKPSASKQGFSVTSSSRLHVFLIDKKTTIIELMTD